MNAILHRKILQPPHRVCKSTCFSNGLEDILEWKGAQYMEYLLPVLGGMGEFAYLKFKNAHPPNMVYWGANTKYLLEDLAKIIDFKILLSENRTFKTTFLKIKEWIDSDLPVMAGALDMYHLPYYPAIHHKRHIPIHYLLLTGYDEDSRQVYLHDCACAGVQTVSYDALEAALNVSVPGMSRKNTIRTFQLPRRLPSELQIAQKGLQFRAEKMLRPPVSMFGIPAMRKLAKEIVRWEDEDSFLHLVTYATTPPELPETFERSNGMRFWKSSVLKALGEKYQKDVWFKGSDIFRQSGNLIINFCKAAMAADKTVLSGLITQVADLEETAYRLLAT